MFRSIVVAAVAGLIAGPALSQARPSPDPATLAAARALVQQTDVRGQISAGMNRMVQDMRSGAAVTRLFAAQPGFSMARAKNPQRFDDVLKKIGGIQAGVAEKVIAQQVPAVVEATVQAYAAHYTAAELKALAEFYKSPLGIALNRKQPLVIAEINRATSELVNARIQAGLKNVQPQIEAEFKRLQPAAPPGKPAAKP